MRLVFAIFVLSLSACSHSSSTGPAAPQPSVKDSPPVDASASSKSAAAAPTIPPSATATATSQTPGVSVSVSVEQVKPGTKSDGAPTVQGNDLITTNPNYDEVPLTFNAACGPDMTGAKLKLKKGSWHSTATDVYEAEVYQGVQTIDFSLGPIKVTGVVEVKDLPVQILADVKFKRLTKASLAPQTLSLQPKTTNLMIQSMQLKSEEIVSSTANIVSGQILMSFPENALFSWDVEAQLELAKGSKILVSPSVDAWPNQPLQLRSQLKMKLSCNMNGAPVPTRARFSNQILNAQMDGDQWFSVLGLSYKLRDGSSLSLTSLGPNKILCPSHIDTANATAGESAPNQLSIPAGSYDLSDSDPQVAARERRCWPNQTLTLEKPMLSDLNKGKDFPNHAQIATITSIISKNGRTFPKEGTLASPASLNLYHWGPVQVGPNFSLEMNWDDGSFYSLAPGPQTSTMHYDADSVKYYPGEGENYLPPIILQTTTPTTETISVYGALYIKNVSTAWTTIVEYNPNLLWYSNANFHHKIAPIRQWGKIDTAAIASKNKYCLVTIDLDGYIFTYGLHTNSFLDEPKDYKDLMTAAAAQKNCSPNIDSLVQKLRQSIPPPQKP